MHTCYMLPEEGVEWKKRAQKAENLYEALRVEIDGGSESATHDDAIAKIKEWQESEEDLSAAYLTGFHRRDDEVRLLQQRIARHEDRSKQVQKKIGRMRVAYRRDLDRAVALAEHDLKARLKTAEQTKTDALGFAYALLRQNEHDQTRADKFEKALRKIAAGREVVDEDGSTVMVDLDEANVVAEKALTEMGNG